MVLWICFSYRTCGRKSSLRQVISDMLGNEFAKWIDWRFDTIGEGTVSQIESCQIVKCMSLANLRQQFCISRLKSLFIFLFKEKNCWGVVIESLRIESTGMLHVTLLNNFFNFWNNFSQKMISRVEQTITVAIQCVRNNTYSYANYYNRGTAKDAALRCKREHNRACNKDDIINACNFWTVYCCHKQLVVTVQWSTRVKTV